MEKIKFTFTNQIKLQTKNLKPFFFNKFTCNKRGAPVKLCKPAPNVDKKDPIKMTHSLGHAMFATTSLPPIDCPNL